MILKPYTTIIKIAMKNAKTLKKLNICKNKLFWTLSTSCVVHCMVPILSTDHNIHVTPNIRNAPYQIYTKLIHAFFVFSGSLAPMINCIPAITKNRNNIPNHNTLIISHICPHGLLLQLESFTDCPG